MTQSPFDSRLNEVDFRSSSDQVAVTANLMTPTHH